MGKISCNVIRDILPLYVDDVLSDDSRALVDEHLSGCDACRQALDKMREPLTLPAFQDVQKQDQQTLHRLKRNLWKILITTTACAVLLALIFPLFVWLSSFSLSLEKAIQRLPEPFEVGDVLLTEEIEAGTFFVCSTNKNNPTLLQSAIIEKKGPLYRNRKLSGYLLLETPEALEPGDLRISLHTSFYTRQNPQKYIIMGVIRDDSVQTVVYQGQILKEMDYHGVRLCYGSGSVDTNLGNSGQYALYDANGNPLEPWME